MLHRPDARLPLPSAITRLCVNERDPFKKNSLPLRIPIDPAAASMSMNGRRMLDEREGKRERGDCRNFPIRYEAPSSHAAATMAPLARKDPRSLDPSTRSLNIHGTGFQRCTSSRFPETIMNLYHFFINLGIGNPPNFKVSLELIQSVTPW